MSAALESVPDAYLWGAVTLLAVIVVFGIVKKILVLAILGGVVAAIIVAAVLLTGHTVTP